MKILGMTHFTKYPTSKEQNVICMKTVEERIDEEKDVEYKRRIATCRNVLPSIFKKIQLLNEDAVYLEEETWHDRKYKHLIVKSHSLTWNKYADTWEESEFSICPQNSNWTQLKQKGGLRIKGFGILGGMIEMFLHGFANKGGWKAIRIMEELMTESTSVKNSVHSVGSSRL
ncbi:PRELI domain-containing protein 2-like isoform X2 [Acanthaster planci]|uniref:PRELI domain-containing protein 2-like isoform X2 n=1 Tax=Acanthaster planci TaxID=133434 RepID=A0A8B8A0G8_ACAPL|nr:PRELI domain-containing protein 2-like isoform X2 [Acanthaster planci]